MTSTVALARISAVSLLFAGHGNAAEIMATMADKVEKLEQDKRQHEKFGEIVVAWLSDFRDEISEEAKDSLLRRLDRAVGK